MNTAGKPAAAPCRAITPPIPPPRITPTGTPARLTICDLVACLVMWRAATCAISCAIAAATFLDFLTLDQPRTDYIGFQPNTFGGAASVDDSRDINVVPTLKTPDDAADPDREISVLLQAQVGEMHEVELTLPPDQRTNIDVSQIRTEAQASDYKTQVMARLLPKAADR